MFFFEKELLPKHNYLPPTQRTLAPKSTQKYSFQKSCTKKGKIFKHGPKYVPKHAGVDKKKPDKITIYVFPQSLVGTVWGGRHKKPQIPHFLVFSKLPASTREFYKPPQT